MIDFNNLTEEQVIKRENLKRILSIILVAYPNWKVKNQRFTLNAWMDMLEGYSILEIEMAVKSYIATDTSGFAPAIGQIIGLIHSLSPSGEKMSAIEAWGYVKKAIRNGYYNSEEEFEKLPDQCKKVIGNSIMLKEWSTMSEDMVNNTVFANFRRSYDEKVKDIGKRNIIAKIMQNEPNNKIENNNTLKISADE